MTPILRSAALLLLAALSARAQTSYEQAPIRYSTAKPTDAVASLQEGIDSGRVRFTYDSGRGYLASLLAALDISVSSQMLVFSKTSFQAPLISPQAPRAIYFNDDVYVGTVTGGEVLEISAVDPDLGAVFYSLAQKPADSPRFVRQTDACLQCHDSSGSTLGVPGHIVRSVFPSESGLPRLNLGSFRTTYRSPYAERWGGWYVTGEHGAMRHLGNATYADGGGPDALPAAMPAASYPAPTSDIVALMVLEHQTHLHNLVTRANFETRLAMLQCDEINALTGDPPGTLTDGTRARIQSNGEPLVEALFYSGEPGLPDPVRGSRDYVAAFEKRGPFDARGRSLRQFDLSRRMFRYPLSWLVYSRSFRALPPASLDYVVRRMGEILSGRDRSAAFSHLTKADRTAIREILDGTFPELARRLK